MVRLFSGLEEFGSRLAVIDEVGEALSYAELAERAREAVAPLGPERRFVALEADNRIASLLAYVGALRAGHVVLLTGKDGAAPTSRIARLFRPQAVHRPQPDGSWRFEIRHEDPVELHPDLAVLLSTSGSTGSPKLVRLSHRNLVSNARSIAEYLEFAEGERAITSLPPYYSFGMSVINSHLETGGALILNDASVSEDAFWHRLAEYGATSFAGVPHTYELLERVGFLGARHPSLRYYTQAGGRLPPEKVALFARDAAAQGRRFYVMYGQTEAAPRMAYVPPALVAEHPDCIGVPVPGGSFRIDSADGMGPGELIYSGPNVMMGYAVGPEDFALGQGPAELRTGDIAERDPSGLYRIIGRASRFSKLFGLRISLDDVEARLRAADITAAVAGDDEGLVVATTGRTEGVAAMLAGHFRLPVGAIRVLVFDELPRLPTGKTDYRTILARGREAAERAATAGTGTLREQVAEILGLPAVQGTDSFVGLGGDSLNYIQVSLLLERHIGTLPFGWERMSFAELEALARRPAPSGSRRSWPSLDTSVVLRALCIILVVLHHVSEWDMAGAAFALIAVSGYNFARFQLPRLESGKIFATVQNLALKIVLPYFALISIAFFMRQQVFWPQYLLYSNYTAGAAADGVRKLTIYWFVETYIVIMLFFCVLYLVPAIRRWSREWPRAFPLVLLVPMLLLRILGEEFFRNAAVFAPHGALMLAYVFLFGWAVARARGRTDRLLLCLAGMVTFYVYGPVYLGLMTPYRLELSMFVFQASILLLCLVDKVPLGRPGVAVLSTIGGASFYIYITHPLLVQPIRSFFGGPPPSAVILPEVLLCLGLGTAIWLLTERMPGLLRRDLPRPRSRLMRLLVADDRA